MAGFLGSMIGGLGKSIALGQLRTWLPAVGGGLTALGVQHQVNPTQFEGALYYIVSSLFAIVPAYFSYMNKHSVKDLVNAAIAAEPGTPEAAAVQAKVS